MALLAPRPGRFEYVHTLTSMISWLDFIECAILKNGATFLRHIRVASIDELKVRILMGIDEMNRFPSCFDRINSTSGSRDVVCLF